MYSFHEAASQEYPLDPLARLEYATIHKIQRRSKHDLWLLISVCKSSEKQ